MLRGLFTCLKSFLFGSLICFISLWANGSLASSGITYHGRILKSDDTPVTSSNVQFKMQIRTPGIEDCLLYEETQTLDLSLTNGMFAVSVGDGNGTRTDSYSAQWDLFEALSNRRSFSFSASDCTGSTTYTPNDTDNRKFRVFFDDGSGSGWQSMPTQIVNYIPMSVESYAVGGFPAKSLFRVEDSGVLGNVSALTTTQYNNLVSLANGTSSTYEKFGELGGSAIPSLTNGQTMVSDGSGGWTAMAPLTSESDPNVSAFAKTSLPTCVAGEVLKSDGTVLSCVTDTSGTLPNVGTPGTYTKVTTDAQGRVTSGSQITGSDITSGTIGGSTSMLTTGDVSVDQLSAHGLYLSNLEPKTISILPPASITADYTLTLPIDDGSSGQTLTTNGSGVLSWTTISGVSPVGSALTTGKVWMGNSGTAQEAYISVNDLKKSDGTNQIPTTCSASQTLTWSSLTDVFTCSDIAITSTQVSGLDTSLDGKVDVAGDTMTGTLNLPSDGLVVGSDQFVTSGGNIGMGVTSPGVFPAGTLSAPNHVLEISGDASSSINASGILALSNNRTTPTSGDVLGALTFWSKNNAGNNVAAISSVLEGSGGANGLGGHLRFYTKEDNVASAVERVRIEAGGNVGIGTGNPSEKLEVVGNIKMTGTGNGITFPDGTTQTTAASGSGSGDFMKDGSVAMTGAFKAIDGSAAAPGVTFSSDTDTGIYRSAADELSLSSGGDQRVVIYDQGMKVIGNTYPLTVQSSQGGMDFMPAGGHGLEMSFYSDSAGSETASIANNGGTNEYLTLGVTGTSGTGGIIELQTAGQTRFHISPDGTVGIGTDTPDAKLEVVGEVRSVDSSGISRLWGSGRPGTSRYGTSGVESGLCSNGGISFGLSFSAVNWEGAAAACPTGTWVCTVSQRGTASCDTDRPDASDDATDCSGSFVNYLANAHVGWLADVGSYKNSGSSVDESGSDRNDLLPCNAMPVWCCSE